MMTSNLRTSPSRRKFMTERLYLLLWICFLVKQTLQAGSFGPYEELSFLKGKRFVDMMREAHVSFMAQDSSKGYELHRVDMTRNNWRPKDWVSDDHESASDPIHLVGTVYYKKVNQAQCHLRAMFSFDVPIRSQDYDCNSVDRQNRILDASGHHVDVISWKTPIQDIDRVWDFDLADILETIQRGSGHLIGPLEQRASPRDYLNYQDVTSYKVSIRHTPRAIYGLPLRASDPNPCAFAFSGFSSGFSTRFRRIHGTLKHSEKDRELVWLRDLPEDQAVDRRPLWLRRIQQSPVPAFYGEVALAPSG